MTYSYDSASQFGRTRTFADVPGNFTLSYDYNIGGELKSIQDGFAAMVTYDYDKTGKLSSVSEWERLSFAEFLHHQR